MGRWRRAFSLPIFYMLLSATSLAVGFLFIKLASARFAFYQLVFIRFFVGLLCIISILLFNRRFKEAVVVTEFRYHFYRAVIVLVSQYCLFYYLTKSSILNATVLVSIAPLFIPLFNTLFFKQPLTHATLVGEGLSLVGVLMMYHPKGNFFNLITLIGLSSSILWALSQSIFAYTLKKGKSESSFFYLFFLVTILSIPGLIFLPNKVLDVALEPLKLNTLVLFLGLGVFSFLNQYFRAKAYNIGDAAKLTTLLYFSVFVAVFLDWSLYDIFPTLLQSIGALLVILGGFLSIYLHKTLH